MRQIVTGLHQYALDYRGWFPLYGFMGVSQAAEGSGGTYWTKPDGSDPSPDGVGYLTAREKKYITDWRVFWCPKTWPTMDESYLADWWEKRNNNGGGLSGYQFFNGNGPFISGYNKEWFAGKATSRANTVVCADRAEIRNSIWMIGQSDPYGRPLVAHPSGANIAFADVHVAFYNFPGKQGRGSFRFAYIGGNDTVCGHE